jgi:16S rRNA (cytidine1402-2'-O)-methyltransferase
VIKTFNECDLVLAEDTRVTIKLLNHIGVKKKLLSCHEFNESGRLALLRELASEGKSCALVSDAGTPMVSDPGYQIVSEAIAIGMDVIPIPGPSAFLLALTGSGLPMDKFVFQGFLPDRKKTRREELEQLSEETRTLIFYVSPHDMLPTLKEIATIFGDRQACLARELTKLHEEFVRGTLANIQQHLEQTPARGECVLVIAGAPAKEKKKADKTDVVAHLRQHLDAGERLKEASVAVAKQLGWTGSEVYQIGLEILDKRD